VGKTLTLTSVAEIFQVLLYGWKIYSDPEQGKRSTEKLIKYVISLLTKMFDSQMQLIFFSMHLIRWLH